MCVVLLPPYPLQFHRFVFLAAKNPPPFLPSPSRLLPPSLALHALDCTGSPLDVRAETVGCGQAQIGPSRGLEGR